jgi:hypothetical protein
MKPCINDSVADVRNAVLTAIGVIKGAVGSLGNLLDDIPPAKMKKVNEAAGTPAGPVKPDPSPPAEEDVMVVSKPKLGTSAKKKRPAPGHDVEEEEKRPAGVDAPKPPAHPPSRPKKPVSASVKDGPDQPVLEEDMSVQEAEDRLTHLPPSIATGLSATAWKAKVEACKELKTWLEENPDEHNTVNEPIVRVLKHKMKDWKENNFNVIKECFEIITSLACTSDISRRCAALVLNQQAVEKIGDMKLNEAYYVCLSSLCSAVGPKFVSG